MMKVTDQIRTDAATREDSLKQDATRREQMLTHDAALHEERFHKRSAGPTFQCLCQGEGSFAKQG